MSNRPTVLAFDVNETLSDMAPMSQRFVDVGATGALAQLWFAQLLRDGFALTAAGSSQAFSRIGEDVLRRLFAEVDLDRSTDEAVGHVMSGFRALALHPDVAGGVRALRAAGLRLVTLSNGATDVAERLLARAGIRDEFEQLLSVDDAGAWKPAAEAYRYAAQRCGTSPATMALVAVHAWDIDGASRAGLQTVWVNRTGAAYPTYFTPPQHTVPGIDALADVLSV